MAYDLEEQEQLANLKAFWAKYGNFLLTVVTVVLLAVAGYRGWQWYQADQAARASVAYHQLLEAARTGDRAKVTDAAGAIFADYGSTVYGQMAALLVAKAHFDAGDLRSARAPLEWAIDNARDDEFRHLARVRLAGVLIDANEPAQAMQLLSAEPPEAFAAAYADRRG
ncbi:MAG: tetratricopeptide repeat protein, partial [Burkholderiales bacterium]